MALSPFTKILQLYANSNKIRSKTQEKVRDILNSTTTTHCIMSQIAATPSQVQSPLDALLISLRCFQDSPGNGAVYRFLDNCVCRLVRKPIHYESARQEFNVAKSPKPTSLLAIVFAEQWQFLVRSASDGDLEAVLEWTSLLLKLLMSVGEDQPTIEHVFERIRETTPNDRIDLVMNDRLSNPISEKHRQAINRYGEDLQQTDISTEVQDKSDDQEKRMENRILLCKPPIEAQDHPELHSWAQKDPQEAIDEGTLGKLILCLCSAYEEVRKQALSSMQRFMSTLKVTIVFRLCFTRLTCNRNPGIASGSRYLSCLGRLWSLPRRSSNWAHILISLGSSGPTCCKY